MKECKKYQKNLVAFLYGELQGDEKKRLESHLNTCSLCRSELDRLKEVKNGADSLNPEIENVMASIDWEALQEKISEAAFEEGTSMIRQSWLRSFLQSIFQPKLRPVYAGLFLGILIGAAVFFMIFRTPHLQVVKNGEIIVPQSFLEWAELEMARRNTIDYLERSQYLLLDFVQSSLDESAGFWQSNYASQKARDLLSKKKYINQQLDKFHMAKAKAICDQIELLFFELAQISEQISMAELKRIQDLIVERQILLKIKIVKKELEKSEV